MSNYGSSKSVVLVVRSGLTGTRPTIYAKQGDCFFGVLSSFILASETFPTATRIANSSSSCSTSRLNGLIPTGNHVYQNFSDHIELGGVDKRVGADVRERYEHAHVVASVDQ